MPAPYRDGIFDFIKAIHFPTKVAGALASFTVNTNYSGTFNIVMPDNSVVSVLTGTPQYSTFNYGQGLFPPDPYWFAPPVTGGRTMFVNLKHKLYVKKGPPWTFKLEFPASPAPTLNLISNGWLTWPMKSTSPILGQNPGMYIASDVYRGVSGFWTGHTLNTAHPGSTAAGGVNLSTGTLSSVLASLNSVWGCLPSNYGGPSSPDTVGNYGPYTLFGPNDHYAPFGFTQLQADIAVGAYIPSKDSSLSGPLNFFPPVPPAIGTNGPWPIGYIDQGTWQFMGITSAKPWSGGQWQYGKVYGPYFVDNDATAVAGGAETCTLVIDSQMRAVY